MWWVWTQDRLFLAVSFPDSINLLTGLPFCLLLSWSYQSLFNACHQKFHSFEQCPQVWTSSCSFKNKVHYLRQGFQALSPYGLPLSMGRTSAPLQWSWDMDSGLLLPEWHSCFTARSWGWWQPAGTIEESLLYEWGGVVPVGCSCSCPVFPQAEPLPCEWELNEERGFLLSQTLLFRIEPLQHRTKEEERHWAACPSQGEAVALA